MDLFEGRIVWVFTVASCAKIGSLIVKPVALAYRV